MTSGRGRMNGDCLAAARAPVLEAHLGRIPAYRGWKCLNYRTKPDEAPRRFSQHFKFRVERRRDCSLTEGATSIVEATPMKRGIVIPFLPRRGKTVQVGASAHTAAFGTM